MKKNPRSVRHFMPLGGGGDGSGGGDSSGGGNRVGVGMRVGVGVGMEVGLGLWLARALAQQKQLIVAETIHERETWNADGRAEAVRNKTPPARRLL